LFSPLKPARSSTLSCRPWRMSAAAPTVSNADLLLTSKPKPPRSSVMPLVIVSGRWISPCG
jgi:hypothetical protein